MPGCGQYFLVARKAVAIGGRAFDARDIAEAPVAAGEEEFGDAAATFAVACGDAGDRIALGGAVEQHHRNAGGGTLFGEVRRERGRGQDDAVDTVLHQLVEDRIAVAVHLAGEQQEAIVFLGQQAS